jgi:hypothetical protein
MCVGIEDLGAPDAVCETCETVSIRYVHTMEHPNYPDTLDCGCVCAGNMEQDYAGARQREAALRKAAGRRRKWLSRQWRTSAKGNPYLNTDGYNVVVYQQGEGWSFRVTDEKGAVTARRTLPTTDAAKLQAFDALIWMNQRK